MIAEAAVVARRETAALLRTWTGWVVIALLTLLTGMLFALPTITPGEPASMRYFFGPAAWVLLVVCPAVSMRLVSEEVRAGTLDALTSAPLSDAAVILGKFAGASAFLFLMLTPTLAYPVLLVALADPAPPLAPVACGYLGLVLAGAMYLALGLLISTLTGSQTLAFLATLIVLVVVMLSTEFVAPRLPHALGDPLAAVSIAARVNTFARGVVTTGHVGFFAAATAGLLASAVATLSARRAL